MTIRKGDQGIDNIFYVDTQVTRVYKGDEILWEKTVAEPLTTTISPAETVQSSIPITVTLSNNYAGTTIKYMIGTNPTVFTYTGPFTVNQSTAYVQGPDITIHYWSESDTEAEPQKTIIYDTRTAMPSKPVVSATVGQNTVTLSWGASVNTTSYNVYRSDVPVAAGNLGTLLSQYQTALTYTDNTAVGGTTYYYTVRAANYWSVMPSDPVTATPTAPPVQTTGWRYLRIDGYGSVEEPATTRLIEFEAWEGTTNRMAGATILGNETISLSVGGGTIASIKDTVKTTTGYPLWWTTTPNARVIIDLGAVRNLTKLNYYSYSTASVQRANRFKILASNTNNGTDWTPIWDMQNNTDKQPILPNGYEKLL
jgi:hypothetical protein